MEARLLALAVPLLLGACAPSFVAVAPKPNEALLAACQDPQIPPGQTDNDYAALMLNLGQAYVNCKQEKAALATWVRGLGK